MDLFSLSLSVCVLMVFLPGAARFSRADENSCPCQEIPQSTTRQEACFQTGSTYSYTCVEGDVRTLRCKENEGVAQWTKYQLDCIPYQRRTTTQSTAAAATDENGCPCPEIPERNLTKPPTQTCFQIGSQFRYQCIDGYMRKSGTSNLIKCEATGGAPQWTEPTLECIYKNSCPCLKNPHGNFTKSSPTACFQISNNYSYPCKEFYMKKMGTSNVMKCKHIEGVPRGTEYRLECKPTSTSEMMPSASASPSVTDERNSTEAITHATAGAVFTVLRLMICSLIGIVFIVHKRKLKNIPVQTADSVRPVNPGPSGLYL